MTAVKTVTIVAFGDSITAAAAQPEAQRWPELVRARLQHGFPQHRFVLWNAGVGGNTSREGLARMDKDVIARRPDYVLVEFGGNDTTIEPHRHVALDEFRSNLASMKAKASAIGARIVMIAFPPVIDRLHAWGTHAYYRAAGGLDAYVESYRHVARDFARLDGLPMVEIDKALRRDLEQNVLGDGVHLTAAGNRVVAGSVVQALDRYLGILYRTTSTDARKPGRDRGRLRVG